MLLLLAAAAIAAAAAAAAIDAVLPLLLAAAAASVCVCVRVGGRGGDTGMRPHLSSPLSASPVRAGAAECPRRRRPIVRPPQSPGQSPPHAQRRV